MWGLCVAWLTIFGAGCVESRVVGGTWERWRELGDAPNEPGDTGIRRGQAYAVELARFEGGNRMTEAFNFAQDVRTSGQIPGVWSLDNGRTVIIYAGKFGRKNHPEAGPLVKSIRAAVIDGKRPFRKAKLTTVEGGKGQLAENDLSQFSGYRTLMLAAFDREYGDNFRAAAEAYAEEVREEHDRPVYFYHGPNQSLVTTGLFTQMDFIVVKGLDAYGPDIRELQLTFPHARRNGDTMHNPQAGTPDNLEPTVIVRVP